MPLVNTRSTLWLAQAGGAHAFAQAVALGNHSESELWKM
jgi:hypothetical protein